ncbi:hypothetical protein NLG97_g3058 [Lecanicillium saksenae]|uniref:Uncharacterized protein n=1 Tax=Lecanicillium saksenae TaxID=468837 RepID=A0ACC1R1U2_9HYPO|nr:hypothetical protein NLG97_g3058 [Lecanicillium saksenae]
MMSSIGASVEHLEGSVTNHRGTPIPVPSYFIRFNLFDFKWLVLAAGSPHSAVSEPPHHASLQFCTSDSGLIGKTEHVRPRRAQFDSPPRTAFVDTMAPKDAGRKKVWAPRTRTGCEVCRTRRIKCDETHPVCKRCIIGNRQCRYPLVMVSPSPPSEKSTTLVEKHQPLSRAPLYQRQPPDWTSAQAMRFFVDVSIPMYSKFQVVENAYDLLFVPGSHISVFPYQPGFIMMMTIQRIKLASLAKNAPVKRGQGLGIEHLWQMFYDNMAETMAHLNHHINERSRPGYIISRIIDLLSVELAIVGSPWRAHLQGFFAVVNLYGGVASILKTWPRAVFGLQYCLIYAIVGNTCSPATDQMSGLDDWSTDDILSVYPFTFYFEFGCPSRVALAIIRITRLRVLVATDDREASKALKSIAREIAQELHDFAPDAWKESYRIPKEPLRSLLAGMFKVASILYAVLSLPPDLAEPFVGVDENDKLLSNARLHYRRILFELIEQTKAYMKISVLSWGFAVLGAAYSDGPEEGKARILQHLRTMEVMENVECGATTMLELFPDFWASGKTRSLGVHPQRGWVGDGERYSGVRGAVTPRIRGAGGQERRRVDAGSQGEKKRNGLETEQLRGEAIYYYIPRFAAVTKCTGAATAKAMLV